jgi:hydroxymethylbilane synthase
MTNRESDPALIRIGSRGSQLALWQANFIAEALRRLGHLTAIEIIRTTGDRMQETAAPVDNGKGVFTREIEEALLGGRIDLAVHSLKDLPTELPDGLTLGAIPRRADPRDVLVSERYRSLEDLPSGAVVGTGSLRRQAQLRRVRPDLAWIEFRGNVDTRLAKLAQGKADAIILAAAGLDRLHKTEWIRQRFSPEVLCPAAGQGALAIECRASDRQTLAAIAPLEERETRRAVTAERRFLAALGGGCRTPIGAYAWSGSGGTQASLDLSLLGVVSSADGREIVSGELHGSDPDDVADRLSRKLLAQGAAAILGIAGELA